jgi:hypothetical protein
MSLSDTFTPAAIADDTLLDALLAGATIRTAAERAGVSISTARRRLADPGFSRRLSEARSEVRRSLVDRLTATATASVGVLAAVLADPAASPSVKVRAAEVALNSAVKWVSVADLEQRIAALEDRADLDGGTSVPGDLVERLAQVLAVTDAL